MKWFFMSGPGGTIAIKARFPNEAKAEAAERWGCDADEITVTDEETYNDNGAHCAPLQKKDAAADGQDP